MRIPPLALRWGALIALSLALGGALTALRMPGALLIGPMIASIGLAVRGYAVRIPARTFVVAQGVLGVMVASLLPLTIFAVIGQRWPIFILGTLSTIAAASLLGWLLARSRLLPGTTAIWGSSPGAATVMTLMSESYGADMRLVALMQYVRVAVCAAVASGMARVLGTPTTLHIAATAGQTSPWWIVAVSLAIALGGAFLGQWMRIPGGSLLAPMVIGIVAKTTGLFDVALPTPILALVYAMLGWGIGMRFTPDVLSHAARVLPRVLVSIVALIAICACFGAVLVWAADVDPLTAYLATSPGGADTAIIIASTTKVDAPFVVAMQIARFVCVVISGPAVARWLSREAIEPVEASP